MPLTMRSTGLESPVEKDRQDFTINSGDWPWGASTYGMFGKPADMRTDGYAPTLDEAKAEFETAWHRWLAWAKLSGVARTRRVTRRAIRRGY